MRYLFLLIAMVVLVEPAALSEEISSQKSEKGSLIISDDHHTMVYQDREGQHFPLYFYNDYYPSNEEGGEQYFLQEFSHSGRYAALKRRIYFRDDTVVRERFTVDFIDMDTGCVFHTLNQSGTTGYWSKQDDATWVESSENHLLVDVSKFKGDIVIAAGIHNAYLCNIEQIHNRDLNTKRLMDIQSLIRDSDPNYGLSSQVLNISSPHVIWGLVTLLSDDNVTFFNDFALALLATKTILDDDPAYLSSLIILESILRQYPDRVQTILHLADAYSFSSINLSFQQKATENYRRYYELMKALGQEDLIPARVLQRLE